jgi:dihydroflavonol-4-reductase
VLVRKLVERGDRVVAALRDPKRAEDLGAAGVELVKSDLSNRAELERQMKDSDAVFHLAGAYRVGIPPRERAAMYDSNVGATERVLDAAITAGVGRIVYVSTINAFGNTRGRVVDETYRRDPAGGFVSWYDETKYLAHEAAEARARRGAPIVIVLPGGVYGRGDHSAVGQQLGQAYRGALRYRALSHVGLNFVHVEDVAEGIILASDRGAVGESYVLGGEIGRLDDGIDLAATLGGRRAPRMRVPVAALRALAPLAPYVGRFIGVPPNLAEVIRASDGVTYWATDARARSELGYAPVDLETGLRRTFGPSSGSDAT